MNFWRRFPHATDTHDPEESVRNNQVTTQPHADRRDEGAILLSRYLSYTRQIAKGRDVRRHSSSLGDVGSEALGKVDDLATFLVRNAERL